MKTLRFLKELFALSRAFVSGESGNVALIFGISTLPVFGLVGSAVDYSRANSARTQMQAALDATAVMLSKKASTMTTAQISSTGTAYFNAMFARPDVTNVVVTSTYTTSGGSQVVMNGTGTFATAFMGMMGFRTMPLNVTATAKWGTSRLRVALVLDNTGSMADDGKMDALKTATKNLLTTLQGAATNNGDVYVSIIPFAKDVNIGASNYGQSYIDWTAWDAANTRCSGFQFGSFCFGTVTTANHNTWNGCITDRGGATLPDSNNYDQNVTAPGSSAASKYPAEQASDCPVAMMGLNYDWTSMNSLVDSMDPAGGTNQPIGLVWGWQSLVGGGPLSVPAEDPNYTYNKIIILMSDGLNTIDRWYGNGSVVSPLVDARMYNTVDGSGTCKNAKTAGITIYTIHVNTGGDPTSTLLQNCASSTDKFTVVTSANQLITTFASIGTALTKLRIAN